MVHFPPPQRFGFVLLSVLALSSRFDGPGYDNRQARKGKHFQYSLCRVVLMVRSARLPARSDGHFQYSLCRVVLMVHAIQFCCFFSVDFFQYSLCRVVLMVRQCTWSGNLEF